MTGTRIKKNREKKTVEYFDYSLLAVLIFLIGFGLLMLYSTSSYSAKMKFGDGMFYLKNQLKAYAVSFIAMWIVSNIDYHWYAKYSKAIFLAAMVVMALVFVPGVGFGSGLSGVGSSVPFLPQAATPSMRAVADM